MENKWTNRPMAASKNNNTKTATLQTNNTNNIAAGTVVFKNVKQSDRGDRQQKKNTQARKYEESKWRTGNKTAGNEQTQLQSQHNSI
jgi:hypothetical protein